MAGWCPDSGVWPLDPADSRGNWLAPIGGRDQAPGKKQIPKWYLLGPPSSNRNTRLISNSLNQKLIWSRVRAVSCEYFIVFETRVGDHGSAVWTSHSQRFRRGTHPAKRGRGGALRASVRAPDCKQVGLNRRLKTMPAYPFLLLFVFSRHRRSR